MPLFGKKDKAGNLCFNFFHADGIPHFPNRFSIRVTFLDNEQKIEFKSRVNKKSQPAYIRYEQVVNYETYTDKEIIESDGETTDNYHCQNITKPGRHHSSMLHLFLF